LKKYLNGREKKHASDMLLGLLKVYNLWLGGTADEKAQNEITQLIENKDSGLYANCSRFFKLTSTLKNTSVWQDANDLVLFLLVALNADGPFTFKQASLCNCARDCIKSRALVTKKPYFCTFYDPPYKGRQDDGTFQTGVGSFRLEALEKPCDKLSAYVTESEQKLSGFHVDTCTSQLAQHNLLVGPPPSHLLIAFSRQRRGDWGAHLGTKVESFPENLRVSISQPSYCSSDGFVEGAIVSLKDVKAQTEVHEYINSDTYIVREKNHFVTVVLGATATVLDDGKAVETSPNSISSRLQNSAILCLYKHKGLHAAVHHRLINIEKVEQQLSAETTTPQPSLSLHKVAGNSMSL
jgi:hypothetical protein